MDHNRNKWISDAFESVKGLPHASPPAHLFNRIQGSLSEAVHEPIQLKQWSWAAAAAAAILILNVAALKLYTQASSNTGDAQLIEYFENTSLISNYNLYE